uniref:PadR family transcriptional regulator n=1 Tax=Lentibacillus songyuanensis TaxID=3136161 RepID=UPI0038621DDF
MPENDAHIPLTEAVYYILLALHTPMHGYGIMQYIQRISNGRVDLGPGTLYGAIKTMVEKGWIQLVDQHIKKRKKEYLITEAGKSIVLHEFSRLQELVDNGNQIIRGENNDR